jgi:glycosyltransferase involved in cell wall biosynthesis
MDIPGSAKPFLLLPDEPLVSIVTPSFNQGAYIESTIRSVLDQDYPQIEYLVIDGGSTDGTLDILRRYEGRLTWISEPDDGQADAINKGWRRSQGHIVAWLNSDDIYYPGAIRLAVAGLRSDPDAAGIYGDCDYIDATGHVLGQHCTAPWDMVNVFCHLGASIPQQSTFLRREAVEAVEYLDRSLHMAMDLDLWLKLGLRFSMRHIPSRLAGFRIHQNSKTVASGVRFNPEVRAIYDRLFARADLPAAIRARQAEIESNIALQTANYCFLAGDLVRARQYAYQSWKQFPRRMRMTMLKIIVISILGQRIWSFYQTLRSYLVRHLPSLNP